MFSPLFRHLLLVTFLAVATQAPSSRTNSSGTDANGWTEVDRRELNIDGDLVTLSPDGQWIAGLGPSPGAAFCIWEVATEAATCVDQQFMIDPLSVRWAPDSSAVAFSIGPAFAPTDSDIMVFDLATGAVTNLTDDGIEGVFPSDPGAMETFPVDSFPTWSADSATLTYIHFDYVSLRFYTTELLTIPREGGEPLRRFAIRDLRPSVVWTPMFALRDGSLLFSTTLQNREAPENGIWMLHPDGAAEQLLPGDSANGLPSPRILRVVEAGPVRLASAFVMDTNDAVDTDTFLIDLDTGEVMGVVVNEGDRSAVSVSAFSPDGRSTIGWEMDAADPHLLLTNGPGRVTDLGALEGFFNGGQRGYDWADNGTLLIPFGEKGILEPGGELITFELGGYRAGSAMVQQQHGAGAWVRGGRVPPDC